MHHSVKSIVVFLIFFISMGYAQAKTTIRVGYLPILDHLTLFVSHAHDHATFQNVDIQIKMFKSWPELAGALKAELVDAAFFLSPLSMDLFNQGLPIETVLLAHRDGSAITIGKNLPIQSAKDLKGKTIAVPHIKSTHTALLQKYLMDSGLSLKDVVTKLITPTHMSKAMQQGKIDAFIVAEPFGTLAQSEGVGRMLTLTRDILKHHIDCIVVVNQKIIKSDPNAVQEWVNSLIRAGQWIEKDKLENGSKQVAKLSVQGYLPHPEAAIIGGLQNPIDRITFDNLEPTISDFKKIVELSIQAGILNKVDLEKFIDVKFFNNSGQRNK